MRYALSATGLATLVIAFTGAALPAKAQQRVAQPPREFRISAAAQERTVTRSLNARQRDLPAPSGDQVYGPTRCTA